MYSSSSFCVIDSLRLRRVIDDERSPANLHRSLRHASAIDEHAGDLGPGAQQRDDILGHLFGVGQPRAWRQARLPAATARCPAPAGTLRQKRYAADRSCEYQQADADSDEIVPDRPGHEARIGLQHPARRLFHIVHADAGNRQPASASRDVPPIAKIAPAPTR